MKSKILKLVISFFLIPTLFVNAQDYDLVILNGRVMDPETMLDRVLNVGVKDGNITIITPNDIQGEKTIDAEGLVVAPGFIDTHFHALDGLSLKMAARDGVTTGMDLEIGAIKVDNWYKAKEGAWPLNYGTGISHEGIRIQVLDPEVELPEWADAPVLLGKLRADACADGDCGWQDTESNLEQLNEIMRLADEGMQQGAIGFNSTVGYMVDGVSTLEMYKLQEVAAKYGRVSTAHVRYHGSPKNPQAPIGFEEILANALVLNGPLLLQHNNDFGWMENEDKLQKVRAQGHNMWSEYYPYTAASTSISSSFLQPKIFENVFGGIYERDIYDPINDKYLNKDEFLETEKEDPSRLVVIYNQNRKLWMTDWLKMPHMTVASDAIYSGLGVDSWDVPFEEYKGHPRTAGTRAKVLRLARENGVPLMFSIAQMSYWPAKHLGDAGLEAMQVRGRIQEGMVADITIFDPENVADQATYKMKQQGLPSVGIPYVIVSGECVVDNSEFKKVWAGKPIRYPETNKSKHEPLSKEYWLKKHAINNISIDDCSVHSHDHEHDHTHDDHNHDHHEGK
ncbi:aminoacylase [Flammeovirga sp. EKP202]|uniref:aminoacylase n=1 Tax=Flammeovirga sp. EKP202 TaxID=2770592 RepID=UPI00165FCB1E|nr:aminoacylase [Flammeovirga sp. EKP202]MBD0404130.1 aminoacylase [Flammeovirga sp. EKP202]